MVHLNLVIRPFKDGNGRMARFLQSYVLAADGTLAPVFLSVEEYLGQNTQEYYDVLGCAPLDPLYFDSTPQTGAGAPLTLPL